MSAPWVLRVRDLRVSAARPEGPPAELLHGVSLTVNRAESLAVVGESGSGKSLLCLSVMGLLGHGLSARGSVALDGGERRGVDPAPREILGLRERELAQLRGERLGMVFQEPMTALDPLRRVGDQVREVMTLHGRAPRAEAASRALELLTRVGLPDPERAARAYPHELSGGQRQRVVLALATANSPDVLLADEPTTALDATVQRQVLELVREQSVQRGTALVLVTHDLPLAASVCRDVVVLQRGSVVESGPLEEVFADPQHPYTRALLDSSRRLAIPRGFTTAWGGAGVEASDGVGNAGAQASDGVGNVGAQATPALEAPPAVELREVRRTYGGSRGPLGSRRQVEALRGVSLRVPRGSRFGLVGESGSGKSTLLRLVTGLDEATSGAVLVDGREVRARRERDLGWLRESVQIVFQDPSGSLDPRMRVADVVTEGLRGLRRAQRLERAIALLADVGLEAGMAQRYPHQLSGGQRQRVAIARALAPRPRILVADEAVSALDVSVRAQVLDLLARIASERDLTLLLVTHDLSVVRYLCDLVAVVRAGEVVESGPVAQVLTHPQHEYTAALVAAAPTLR